MEGKKGQGVCVLLSYVSEIDKIRSKAASKVVVGLIELYDDDVYISCRSVLNRVPSYDRIRNNLTPILKFSIEAYSDRV